MIGILLVVFALLVQLSFPFTLQKLHSKTLNGYISKINSPSSISFASTKSRLCATTTDPSAIGTDTWDGIDLNLSGQDSISELVDKKPIMIPHTATVLDAVKEMNNLNRGSVLIVDANNKIAGIFTERDFVSKILETERSSATTPISAVMTPATKIVVGKLTDSLNECKQLMLKNNVRHLPIVDGQDYPVGLISMREIVRAVQKSEMIRADANFFGDTLAQIQQQSRDRANLVALAEGDEGSRRDTVRGGFVIVASIVGALLLQGSWVHDHEWLSMSFTFLLGYVGIIFETYFEFNKAGIALLMSTALWVIFAGTATATGVDLSTSLGELSTKVSEVSEVIFFILGAMTIVEIVDAHQGFKVVTDVIDSKNKRGLMRVLGVLTFFMSAILDNLTTTIVMVSLIKKLLPDPEDRKLFGAMIVIAANAGGAWTPIGDVTTTMLWINGQITALPTMTGLLFPSLLSTVVTILALERQIPEDEAVPPRQSVETQLAPRGKLVFATGILGLLSVPVFKATTGLPPYLGMLAALGTMWSLTDAIHSGDREDLMAPAALKKIDTSGVLFFLGILLSVGALDSAGLLRSLAELLDSTFPDQTVVAALIGFASALIDNVPLVAATMGMYDIAKVPADSQLWQLIAFCAGTGGSLLVIGSAAGVALMGLEKVDFVWYAKRITLPALAGYLSGIALYIAQHDGLNNLMQAIGTQPAIAAMIGS